MNIGVVALCDAFSAGTAVLIADHRAQGGAA